MSPRATMIRAGVIAAVALVLLGAASATPWIVTIRLPSLGRRDEPVPEVPQITIQPQERGEGDPALTHTIAMVAGVLFAAAVIGLVALGVAWVVRRLRRAWRPEDDQGEPDVLDGDVPGEAIAVDLASLATAVARARAHLAADTAPQDAVIAAWVALEDEAAFQGAARQPAQTPTEFTSALLQHTPAPPRAVAELRGLYHRARFTSRPVTAEDVRRARTALSSIAEAIDAAVGTTGSPW